MGNSAKRSSPARYLALGDSYTIGEGVPAQESLPFQLCACLRQAGVELQEPDVLARTGWTSAELARAIQSEPPSGPFELVTLLAGVNNQYRGLALESYRSEFHDLLARAVAFAGGDSRRVIVISIPDWGQTPFGRGRNPAAISAQIEAFNRANRAEAAALGTRYVSIDPPGIDDWRSPDWTASDGLHPSGRQYAAWVERILPEALAIFLR